MRPLFAADWRSIDVRRKFQAVVTDAGDQPQRIDRVPMLISIDTDAVQVGVVLNVHLRRFPDGRNAVQQVGGVSIGGLIARADN